MAVAARTPSAWTWNELCRQYPDRWVVLADNIMWSWSGPDAQNTRLVSAHETFRAAWDQRCAERLRTRRRCVAVNWGIDRDFEDANIGCFWTGPDSPRGERMTLAELWQSYPGEWAVLAELSQPTVTESAGTALVVIHDPNREVCEARLGEARERHGFAALYQIGPA